MNVGKRIVLSCLLVYNLQECLSQISEEYYYGSFENFTEIKADLPTPKPVERQQIHQHRNLYLPYPPPAGKMESLFQNMEKKKGFSKWLRKKFFRRKNNLTRKDVKPFAYDLRPENITRVFYEWIYSNETFHGDDIPGLEEYEDYVNLTGPQRHFEEDWVKSQKLNDGLTNYTDKLDEERKIVYYGNQKQLIYTCYFISTTYQNAIDDLRHYYALRYLYLNNLAYEVGYLVHEIVQKYSVVLELFHIIQQKYYHRTEYHSIVPTSHMFYMYTQILYESKQIIHLCNMAQELEKKYKNPPNTLFEDYKNPSGLDFNADGNSPRGDGRAKYIAGLKPNSAEERNYKIPMDMLALYREKERQRHLNESKRNRKDLLKWGVYRSTERSKKPRRWGYVAWQISLGTFSMPSIFPPHLRLVHRVLVTLMKLKPAHRAPKSH